MRLLKRKQKLKEPEIRKGLTPDFIGTYSIGELDLKDGLFYMYFYGSEKVSEEPLKHNINGTIDDKFGTATFEGEVSEDMIKFIKEYDKKSQKRINVDQYPHISYEAKKINGIFIGEYTIKGFVVMPCSWGIDVKERGKFIMYAPVTENKRNSEMHQVPVS